MNTTSTLRSAAATTLLAGSAVLAAGAAHAGVAPIEPGAPAPAGQQVNKVQVEHAERAAHTAGLSPQIKAKTDRMERAQQRGPHPQPVPQTPSDNPSDPSSLPVTLFALLGGTLVAGGAGFTVYRYRHHAPAGTATA